MGVDAWITLGALLAVLVVLVFEWMSADVALMAALALVVATGVIPLDDALLGFANPTLLALASLYVVAAALRNTGALTLGARYLLGSTTAIRPLLARLVAPVSVGSAFLNNTPIVAMAVPAVQSWCDRHDVDPSRLLLPISYASIFGGMCTLMGTSTNLVAHGMLQSAGMDGLGFFELAAVGVPCTLVGWVYLVFVGPLVVPETAVYEDDESHVAPSEEEVVEIEIVEEAEVVGQQLADTGLRHPPGLRLNRIEREGASLAPVDDDEELQVGDHLYYVAVATEDTDAKGLKLAVADIDTLGEGSPQESSKEQHSVVVRDDSRLVGETIEDSGLQQRFNAVVDEVRRGGSEVEGPVSDISLKAGDTLRVRTGPDFRRAFEDSADFYVTSRYEEGEEEAALPVTLRERADMIGAMGVLVGVVGLSAAGFLHIAVWALIGAVLLIATGVVPAMRARDAIDWKVLVVIGAALGLGEAMEASGAAKSIGMALVGAGQAAGPLGLLAALLVGTSVLTNMITNNGAVALFFPIALSVADEVGIEARPLVIAITVAGSMALATPLGYQTNLMVYSAGDYRFVDFVRFGIPLQIVLTIVAVAVIPLFWSF